MTGFIKTNRAEIAWVASTLSAALWFVATNFQTKSEAGAFRAETVSMITALSNKSDQRFENAEDVNVTRFRRMYDKLETVADDVHYIKGRIDGKK